MHGVVECGMSDAWRVVLSPQGPLQPLVTALRECINKTGAALEAVGADTLGQLIISHLDKLREQG